MRGRTTAAVLICGLGAACAWAGVCLSILETGMSAGVGATLVGVAACPAAATWAAAEAAFEQRKRVRSERREQQARAALGRLADAGRRGRLCGDRAHFRPPGR